ncbi:DUF3958 family protein [Rothia sp. CCM 9417]|uniref:DUF3958 family protein n=1 Tax=unclassified Rothia (in: high G+C Gram-positive bacteria) TaxID=2689056 RepID=UPI003AE0F45C
MDTWRGDIKRLELEHDDLHRRAKKLENLIQEFATHFWQTQHLVDSVAQTYRDNPTFARCAEDVCRERRQMMGALESAYTELREQISAVQGEKDSLQEKVSRGADNEAHSSRK